MTPTIGGGLGATTLGDDADTTVKTPSAKYPFNVAASTLLVSMVNDFWMVDSRSNILRVAITEMVVPSFSIPNVTFDNDTPGRSSERTTVVVMLLLVVVVVGYPASTGINVTVSSSTSLPLGTGTFFGRMIRSTPSSRLAWRWSLSASVMSVRAKLR